MCYMRRLKRRKVMERIRQELAGHRLPAYVEEILTQNYCPGFMRMSMVREREHYSFSYKPGAFRKLDYVRLSLYEKMILIRSLITLCEKNKEHLISPESYLIEPELIYLRDNSVSADDVKLMFYPDIKALSFRYKLVLFADRILDKRIKEEKDAADLFRQASEQGDINRMKLMLEKQITRHENRIAEGRKLS